MECFIINKYPTFKIGVSMKKFTLLLLLIAVTTSLFCDEAANDPFEKRKNDFNKQKDKRVKAYDLKREEMDREFNKRLKESWEEFNTRIEDFGIGPKPENLPKAKEVELEPVKKDPVIMAPVPPKKKMEPAELKPEPKDFEFEDKSKKLKINYFGDSVKLNYPEELNKVRINGVSDKSISRGWELTSKTDYNPLVIQLENYINEHRLNPWGTYLLINKVAEELYKKQPNRVLFTAFTLTQLGMGCKIAHSDNNAYLLLPSNKPLYGKPYLTIENTKYYIISPGSGKIKNIKTYTADFPGVPREFNLTVSNLPVLKEKQVNKKLSFDYNGQKYSVNISYNKTLVEFFKDYPQTHYENYFDTQLFHKSRESLVKGLTPLIKGKSETEAVNILLHFVQKSFEYKTDQEQFNREKPLFPEETLHYVYSDCEDRSVLFTYLVKELLGLKVVGLKYPGHMSTGVLLTNDTGDTVRIGAADFTIADPTFINANIGMAMPDYKNKQPEIIGIKQ